jgi:hypothetical protein
MKIKECRLCGKRTNQKDVCVLCATGITQMQQELVDLLKRDKQWNLLHKLKIDCK